MRITATTYQRTVHLKESELRPTGLECPACRYSGEREPVFCLQKAPEVQMLHCPRCHVASASSMPLPEVLDRYYRGDYFEKREEKVTFGSAASFARRILRSLPIPSHNGQLRFLDFGGGDGSLVYEVAKGLLERHSGLSISIDLVDYALPRKSEHDAIVFNAYQRLEEVDGTYDVVFASAILEHIPDVNPVMTRLFGMIKPAGCFYSRTPWVLPLASLGARFDFTFPGHVHDMGASFWGRIPALLGRDVNYVFSRPSPVESSFHTHFLRTCAAHILKWPAYAENLVSSEARKDRIWTIVGGWEVLLRLKANSI